MSEVASHALAAGLIDETEEKYLAEVIHEQVKAEMEKATADLLRKVDHMHDSLRQELQAYRSAPAVAGSPDAHDNESPAFQKLQKEFAVLQVVLEEWQVRDREQFAHLQTAFVERQVRDQKQIAGLQMALEERQVKEPLWNPQNLIQVEERLEKLERLVHGQVSSLYQERVAHLENTLSHQAHGHVSPQEVHVPRLDSLSTKIEDIQKWRREVDDYLKLNGREKASNEKSLNQESTASGGASKALLEKPMELQNERLQVMESSLKDQLELQNKRLQVVESSLEEQRTHKMDAEMQEKAIAQEACVERDLVSETGVKLPASSATDRVCPRNYILQESIYDAAIFMCTNCVDNTGSVFILIGFILNLALQLGVVVVVELQFTVNPLPDEVRRGFARWRSMKAHAVEYADSASGASLAARVCAMDSTLSMSSEQLWLRESTLAYLDDAHSGQWLCVIAVILWSFLCAAEVRQSMAFVLALWQVPRSKRQSTMLIDDEGVHVLDLSLHRLLFACVVALCRCIIAFLLLSYGSWWLSYTFSVRDLLLNASALGFVLEIDNVIFTVLTPIHLIGLINSVEPLTMPSSGFHSYAVPFGLGIWILSFVLAMRLTVMQDMSTRLKAVHDEICGPGTHLDFLVGSTEYGRMYYADSTPSDQPESAAIIAQREVLQLIMDRDPEADKYATKLSSPSGISKNSQYLQSYVDTTVYAAASTGMCKDANGPTLGGALFVATGDKSLRGVETCAEAKKYCGEGNDSLYGTNVRLMCPETCGCHDPMSGLWILAYPEHGCPWNDCRLYLHDKVAEYFHTYGCQDKTLTELQRIPGWSQFLDLFNETADNTDVFHEASSATVDKLRSTGCKAFQELHYVDRMLMCGTFNFMVSTVPLGAGIMCPESCGCYYDYCADPEVPPGYAKYTPNGEDLGLCPIKSCHSRYVESAAKYAHETGSWECGSNAAVGGEGDGDADRTGGDGDGDDEDAGSDGNNGDGNADGSAGNNSGSSSNNADGGNVSNNSWDGGSGDSNNRDGPSD